MNQSYAQSEELLAKWREKSEVIDQCMILTKIWLRQRSLDQVWLIDSWYFFMNIYPMNHKAREFSISLCCMQIAGFINLFIACAI